MLVGALIQANPEKLLPPCNVYDTIALTSHCPIVFGTLPSGEACLACEFLASEQMKLKTTKEKDRWMVREREREARLATDKRDSEMCFPVSSFFLLGRFVVGVASTGRVRVAISPETGKSWLLVCSR